MEYLGPYTVGVAFWVFIGTICVTGIITDYKRKRGSIEVLRLAIEKGQTLDPALIEHLTRKEQHAEQIDPVHVELGGIITIASGVGVCLLSFFLSRVASAALFPVLGAGVVAICVGVGLLIGSRALSAARERERAREESRSTRP